MRVLSFDQALAEAKAREGDLSVLLGNGFSIDWNREIFDYASLHEEAELTTLSTDKEDLFTTLGTHDFEKVTACLTAAAKLVDLYKADSAVSRLLRADAQVLKNGLADVIARVHPERPVVISPREAKAAREFLAKFDYTFTLNYDLLLYWVLCYYEVEPQPHQQDGFRPTGSPPILVWDTQAAEYARVFYLHGALHLFAEEEQLHKLRYGRRQPLVAQLRDRLDDGHYPLIVMEGTSEEKIAKIERNAYLSDAHQRLKVLGGTLFLHGVSLTASDDHIIETLASRESKVEALYVSFYGPECARDAREVKRGVWNIQDRRAADDQGLPLEVSLYPSETARVWR